MIDLFYDQLEKYHSPVLKDFMVCLRELMKDYKSEIKGWLIKMPF